MADIDKEYVKLCEKILTEGREYENVNRGVKRLQIPSYTFRHEMKNGFPATTGKKLYYKGIVAELLWFLRGQTNVWHLQQDKVHIWDKDAYNSYKQVVSKNSVGIPMSLYMGINKSGDRIYIDNADQVESFSMFTFEEFCEVMSRQTNFEEMERYYSYEGYTLGDVGQNYSAQWRNYNGKVDQIRVLIEGMKKDIMSSRLKVNAWNPSELDMTALPPCHDGFQIIGVPLTLQERIDYEFPMGNTMQLELEDGTLLDDLGTPKFGFELHWNQRSVDTFLGLPFNIASYATLGIVLQEFTSYPSMAIEGALKCVHFYDNQYEEAREMVARDFEQYPNCEMRITTPIDLFGTTLDDALAEVKVSDFNLIGYTSHKAVKVEMLAPKEL